MSVFDRRYETMPRAELEQLQLERLQALLVRLKRHVRCSREKLGDVRVESLDELSRLPFTTPEDLAESFPYGLFAFPLREVIRLHSTVGPEGKPLVIGHTRNDLIQWSRLVARQLVASGITANDVIQVCLGGSSYLSTSGYVLGAELIEASVIAEDPRHIDYQVGMLQNYRPTVLITTPTYAGELMQALGQRRIDPPSLHLRTVVLSRPVSEETRQQLAAGLLAAVQCNFGLDEVLDPGFCVECAQHRFHVHEDQFLVEICDGELVISTLAREAMPLLRYRTRVACELIRDKCPCGRVGVVIKPSRRLDRRLCVNEKPLYESQIAEVLSRTRAAKQCFHTAVSERRAVVSIEMSESLFGAELGFLEKMKREIESELLARLGVETEVRFADPQARGKSDGGA